MRCFLKFDNTLKSCMLFSIMNVRQELLKCKRKKTQPLINCPGENTCYFTHWNVVIGLFYYLTPTRMAIIKIQTIISVGLGYRELGTLIHGNTRWCSHCDAQFGTKIKRSYIWPMDSMQEKWEYNIHTKTCTGVFIAVVFMKAKK